MPMVNGRFYMNPALGAGMEEARSQTGGGDLREGSGEIEFGNAPGVGTGAGPQGANGPVHRVEIEAANGGFMARLLRHPAGVQTADGFAPRGGAMALRADGNGDDVPATRGGGAAVVTRQAGNGAPRGELHVFTHHQDLIDFLKRELTRQA